MHCVRIGQWRLRSVFYTRFTSKNYEQCVWVAMMGWLRLLFLNMVVAVPARNSDAFGSMH